MIDELKVKIGSKDEKYWTDVLKQSEDLVLKGRNDLVINEAIVKLAKEKIKVEKEKFK